MSYSRRITTLKPGVNIYGYVFAEHGVGQEAREMVQIVQQTGLDFSVVPYTDTCGRQNVHFAELGTGESVYDINLICVNADTVAHFVRHFGLELLKGRYNIGMWAWEVEELPDWMAYSALFLDEIWGCSKFTASAVARSVSCPVFPLPIPISAASPPLSRRQDLGLSENFLYLFCFDFNSIFERKNALALIAAFKLAFPPGHGAELLIKTVNGNYYQQQLGRLHAAAFEHPDIRVVDGYVESDQQQLLMSTCDAYVSLHRSEGFGFTLAEAMALGKPVIATGYSGNLDFMNDENSYLVPHHLVGIPEGCDPYPSTSQWAEPNVEEAADLMRSVFNHPDEAARRAERARQDIEQRHTLQATAAFVSERVGAIHQKTSVRENRSRGYSVTGYIEDSAERQLPALEQLETEAQNPTRSYRGFSSLRRLLKTQQIRVTEESIVSDLVCGSLDGTKLEQGGRVAVWGWAYDPRTRRPASAVALFLNRKQVAVQVLVGGDRPDVAAFLDDPGLAASGWGYSVPSQLLSRGENIFEAYAQLDDGHFGKLEGEGRGRIVLTTAN